MTTAPLGSWPYADVAPAPPWGLTEVIPPPTLERLPTQTGNLTLSPGDCLLLRAGSPGQVHQVSARTWTLNGPCYVVAEPGAVIDGGFASQLTLAGTGQAILAGLTFQRAKLRTASPNIAIRGCVIHDWPSAIGSSSVMVALLSGCRNFFADRCEIYDCGPVTVEEADVHGFKASAGADVTDFWIAGCHLYRLAGDGVQLGSATGAFTVLRGYVLDNHMHDNGENGVDLKKCQDIVVAHNLIERMLFGTSDPGRGIVIHDGTIAARVIGNVVRDVDGEGIVSTGSVDTEVAYNQVSRAGIVAAQAALRAYSSTGNHWHHNDVFESPIPWEFSANPPVNAHDNRVDPEPEGEPPDAPIIVDIEVEEDMDAAIAFTQPSTGGAVEEYDVLRTTDGGAPEVAATIPAPMASSPIVVPGQDVGHVYGFSLRARNRFGSQTSGTEFADYREPAAPTITVSIP